MSVALPYPLHGHSGPVRDFPVQQPQQLFPDNLRRQHPLGLVGESVLFKEVASRLAELFQLADELLHAAAVLGGYRHHCLKGEQG